MISMGNVQEVSVFTSAENLTESEIGESLARKAVQRISAVEKLRREVDILEHDFRRLEDASEAIGRKDSARWRKIYAAPKRTETSFDTPDSCIVTP